MSYYAILTPILALSPGLTPPSHPKKLPLEIFENKVQDWFETLNSQALKEKQYFKDYLTMGLNCSICKDTEMELLEERYNMAMQQYFGIVEADHTIESRVIPPKNADSDEEKKQEIRKHRLFTLDDISRLSQKKKW